MKILLTADWHIGVRGDSELYHKIFEKWVTDFLLPTIEKEKIERLYILGDFFDNRNTINVKTENIALSYLDLIAFSFCEVKLLLGNHDIYFKNSRDINSLAKFEDIDRVKIIDRPTIETIGKRTLHLVPWFFENEKEEVFKIKADICLGHFPFTGFEMVSGVIETKGYSLEDLGKNYLKVFSGHFHHRNEVYFGNPFQMTWADSEDQKGVTVLDTDTLNTKFIPNTISPIYKKVYLSQLKNKTVNMDIFKNNFIKLFLDDKYTDKIIEKLQEVALSKNPLSFTIEGLGDEESINTDVAVNDLTNPIESLILWLDKIQLKKGIDKTVLFEKINTLYNSSI